MLERVIRKLRAERGLTLVEMTVTIALLGVIMSIVVSIMFRVQTGIEREIDRNDSANQVRLAAQQIDREVRSGNLLYDPAQTLSGYDPYQYLIVYTQTNANTRNPGNRCVQWRLSDGKLQRRDWTSTEPSESVTAWRVVAENLVVPSGSRTFELDPNSAGRTVNFTFVANANAASGGNVTIKASVTGRNTVFQYPPSVCSTIPPV